MSFKNLEEILTNVWQMYPQKWENLNLWQFLKNVLQNLFQEHPPLIRICANDGLTIVSPPFLIPQSFRR